MQIEAPHHYSAHQRTINQQQSEIQQLRAQNQSLKSTVKELNTSREIDQSILNNDIFFRIWRQLEKDEDKNSIADFENCQQLSNRIEISQDKILLQEKQICFLRNILNQKESTVLNIKTSNQRLIEDLDILQRKAFDSEIQINIKNQRISYLEKRVQESQVALNKQAQRLYEKEKQLLNMKVEYQKQLYQKENRFKEFSRVWSVVEKLTTNNKTQQMIEERNDYSFDVQSFTSGQSKLFTQMNSKFKQHQQIMEELGKDLDSRNQELIRLQNQKAKLQNQLSFLYSNQNHTHSVSMLIDQLGIMGKKYEELLQSFRQIKQQYSVCAQQKVQLQKQYFKLKVDLSSVKELKQKLMSTEKQLQEQVSRTKNLSYHLRESDANALELLKENEAFHYMIYLEYGQKVYQSIIDKQVQKYEKRESQRGYKLKYGNITELINMNRKLKDKYYGKKEEIK